MLNIAESGHLVFRATSALERGELKSKGGGKKSIHFNRSAETVELILRTVISVNQRRLTKQRAKHCHCHCHCHGHGHGHGHGHRLSFIVYRLSFIGYRLSFIVYRHRHRHRHCHCICHCHCHCHCIVVRTRDLSTEATIHDLSKVTGKRWALSCMLTK